MYTHWVVNENFATGMMFMLDLSYKKYLQFYTSKNYKDN